MSLFRRNRHVWLSSSSRLQTPALAQIMTVLCVITWVGQSNHNRTEPQHANEAAQVLTNYHLMQKLYIGRIPRWRRKQHAYEPVGVVVHVDWRTGILVYIVWWFERGLSWHLICSTRLQETLILPGKLWLSAQCWKRVWLHICSLGYRVKMLSKPIWIVQGGAKIRVQRQTNNREHLNICVSGVESRH